MDYSLNSRPRIRPYLFHIYLPFLLPSCIVCFPALLGPIFPPSVPTTDLESTAIDFQPHYTTYLPSSIELPSWTSTVYEHYIATYNDPLYSKDPAFFQLYLFIEAIFSVPACFWGIRGLVNGNIDVS